MLTLGELIFPKPFGGTSPGMDVACLRLGKPTFGRLYYHSYDTTANIHNH